MKKFWVSTRTVTCQVDTDDEGIIVFTAPIWKRFLGCHIKEMIKSLFYPVIMEYL